MKHWSVFMLTSAFLLSSAAAVPARGKPLPPAFGKELVRDESTEERNESRDAEMEEESEKREGAAKRHSGGRGARGKIHIELDGDEDGGDSGSDDDGF